MDLPELAPASHLGICHEALQGDNLARRNLPPSAAFAAGSVGNPEK